MDMLSLAKRLFSRISGIDHLDRQIEKFRGLRDSYYEANRQYYGEFLASLLDGPR